MTRTPPDITDVMNDPGDDLAMDMNCDGIEGDAGRSVFASDLQGNDVNPGTQVRPVKTIARAIVIADADPDLDRVLVSAGTCGGRLSVRPGVSVYGSYDANDWSSRSAANVVMPCRVAPGSLPPGWERHTE